MNIINQAEESSSSTSKKNKCKKTFMPVVFQSLNDFLKSSFSKEIISFDKKLTYSFKVALSGMFNTPNNIFFKDILNAYKSYEPNQNGDLSYNPYLFLKNILQYLHRENMTSINSEHENEYNREKQKYFDGKNLYSLFKKYCEKADNSVISKNIFYSEIIVFNCEKCKYQNFDFSLKPILELELNIERIKKIISKENLNSEGNNVINLKNCFKVNFTYGTHMTCPKCHNNEGMNNRLLIKTPNLLIIHFNRSNQKGINDIKFELDIDLEKFLFEKKNIHPNIP